MKKKPNPTTVDEAVGQVIPLEVDLGLVRDLKGRPLPTVANAVQVLNRHPDVRGRFHYDVFRDQVRSSWGGPEREWQDCDDIQLQVFMQTMTGMLRIARATVADAVENRC